MLDRAQNSVGKSAQASRVIRDSARSRQLPDPRSPTIPAVAPPDPDQRSPLERFPGGPPVTITHESSITGDTAERLWELYRDNFEPLAELAVMVQSLTRQEMIEGLADPRIIKIIGWEHGNPVGFGMVTNHLEMVPELSPQYFHAKYPEQAARKEIFIGMYVLVAPDHRGLTLFHRLYLEMWQVPARVGGLMVWDVCAFNRTMFKSDVLAQRIADNFPKSNVEILDQQTWYVAELPEPIPE
jgi:hypothetical protein